MKCVLVIDDDKRIRDVIVAALTGQGYEVREAENGKEGIASYTDSPTDLIITDLVMPEKEGIETIVEFRRKFPQIKILVVSGSRAGDLHMARMLGANRTLAKPFNISDLLDSVEQMLA